MQCDCLGFFLSTAMGVSPYEKGIVMKFRFFKDRPVKQAVRVSKGVAVRFVSLQRNVPGETEVVSLEDWRKYSEMKDLRGVSTRHRTEKA